VRIAGYFGYPDCLDRLFARCRDAVEDVRRAALEHIAFLDDPRVLPTLVAAVRFDTPRARAAAAHALGRLTETASAEPVVAVLTDALADSDAWVRCFAARALGQHRAGAALGALITVIERDTAMQVRLAAVEAIGRIGGPDAVSTLAPFAQQEGDLAAAALRALGTTGSDESWPPLRAALRSNNRLRQVEAIQSVALRSGEEAPALLEWVAAASGDKVVVHEGIQGLATLASAPSGCRQAIEALVRLTADPERRDPSILALGSLSPLHSDAVAAGLSDPRPQVRSAVVEALGRMRHERATAWLRRALDDPAAEVRKTVVGTLRRLGSRGIESRLAVMARTDPDEAVRHAAGAALGYSVGDRRALSSDSSTL
jgi:HEAT repeat protein